MHLFAGSSETAIRERLSKSIDLYVNLVLCSMYFSLLKVTLQKYADLKSDILALAQDRFTDYNSALSGEPPLPDGLFLLP
jgi:hypothetical protein